MLCCLLLVPDCSYILQFRSEQSVSFFLDLVGDCFVLSRQKLYVGMVCMYCLAALVLVDVMVMSST